MVNGQPHIGTMLNVPEFNALSDASASDALARCCGASRWVAGMLAARPFASKQVHALPV
jgi:hypothetical protein